MGAMKNFTLSAAQVSELRRRHRTTREKRHAYRINAVILLGTGWTLAEVSEALLFDEETLRNWLARYRAGGVDALCVDQYTGGAAHLDLDQHEKLAAHLQEVLYQNVAAIVAYVDQIYGVKYSVSGMTELLHRLGFVYKKPKLVPAKADAKAQRDFIELYEKLKQNKGADDPIYFMDGTHPQHNAIAAYGWIKCGQNKEISSNTGRQRVNINGALCLDGFKAVVRMDETINAQSTIELMKQIEKKHRKARVIHVICDNAKYYRSKLVKEYLRDSRIRLVFLPPYAPNLNLIERLWRFFKKKVLYNQHYASFADFQQICTTFFADLGKYKQELKTLLTENFQILNS
jgi:transposase